MIGTIKYIAKVEGPCKYQACRFEEFVRWCSGQKIIQIDIETDVTDWWNTRRLISIQFGSCYTESVQWFFQWSELTDAQKAYIKKVLEDRGVCKLAHNVTYEYVVLRFYDIILENVYDTQLCEQVLKGGSHLDDYALADLSWKYLRIIMDKTLQTSFGDNIITEAKILYGITDVAFLSHIRIQQILQARTENLLNVFALENDVVLAFGDITFNGMKFDHEKWRENISLAQPIVDEYLAKLNAWLMKEPLHSAAVAKGFISDKDRVMINFNSPPQKKELLQLIFPDIIGAGKPVLKAYLRDNGKKITTEMMTILIDMLDGSHITFSDYLVANHRDYLVNNEFLIPAGKITINWNSGTHQVLPLFQLLIPRLKGLAEEERAKHVHPILKDYEKYMSALMLVTDLGEDWIAKYVGPDGYVRTNFNLVLVTGRVSSKNPNMQNLIVTEEVGTRYRNAFICEKGWTFVDSDYISQELMIIAYLSKDPVWMSAIEKSQDLHSVTAELLYGKKWLEAAEPNCAYYRMVVNADGKMEMAKQKCDCKRHKPLRYDIKSINFGLAYGMSEIKLASELGITRSEALTLLNTYFKTFPAIKRLLNFLGEFGVRNGYIMTLAPFFRKRWFPYWKEYSGYIDMHLQEIKYVPTLGEIERASKNMPIQGSSADITKCAMVLMRDWIRDDGLRDSVKMCAQVHDQITTITTDEKAEYWKPIMDRLMREAALLVIPTGILKADTNTTPTWTK